ncbi:MAG: hypothetical protein IJ588_10225 [Prevotella sp.]|nr:hypothetical protein [Prevotella sp.]
MKKIIITLTLLLTTMTAIQAQEVYTEVKKMAQEKVDNPNSAPIVRNINRFKVDALNYMAMKMREEMPDSSAAFLDDMALALHHFINDYSQSLVSSSQQPAAYQTKVIKAYIDASYSNPLFRDPDQDTALVYFRNGNSLTRFSLDTDWRRAVLAAKEAIKQIQ